MLHLTSKQANQPQNMALLLAEQWMETVTQISTVSRVVTHMLRRMHGGKLTLEESLTSQVLKSQTGGIVAERD